MEQIVDELSKIRFSDSDKIEPESFFIKIKLYYQKNQRHKYSEISKVVYEFKDDSIDILRINLSEIKKMAYEDGSLDVSKKIDKLIDHADLAEYQRKLIEDVGKEQKVLIEGFQRVLTHTRKKLAETKEETEEAKGELIETKTQLKIAKEELIETKSEINNNYDRVDSEISKLRKDSSGIYTQFVTILGVFAAIIFGAFGGVEILGNVLGNIQDVSTPKLIVFSSFSIAGIVFLLFILMSGIARLTDKNIRSCNCDYHNAECKHSAFTKHPTIIIISFILFYTAMVGAFGYITEYEHILDLYNITYIFEDGITFTFVLFLLLSPIIFIWLFHHKRTKDSNNNGLIKDS